MISLYRVCLTSMFVCSQSALSKYTTPSKVASTRLLALQSVHDKSNKIAAFCK